MKDPFGKHNRAAFPRKPGSKGTDGGSAGKTSNPNRSAFPKKPDGKSGK